MSQTSSLPSLDEFASLAEEAWQAMPAGFREMCGSVIIRVDDFADKETLDYFGMDNPYELTGLYHGVDLSQKSTLDSGSMPDQVWLYRKPILAEWRERGDIELRDLILHVLVHEIGHHFGLSDDDMHRIEDEA